MLGLNIYFGFTQKLLILLKLLFGLAKTDLILYKILKFSNNVDYYGSIEFVTADDWRPPSKCI